MEMKYEKSELLHGNVATSVTYALDVVDFAASALVDAEQAVKDGKGNPVACAISLTDVQMLLYFANAYLALYTSVTVGPPLDPEKLKDYFEGALSTADADSGRMQHLRDSYNKFLTLHKEFTNGKKSKARQA